MDTKPTPTHEIWNFGQGITDRLLLQADELSRITLELDAMLKAMKKEADEMKARELALLDKVNKMRAEPKGQTA